MKNQTINIPFSLYMYNGGEEHEKSFHCCDENINIVLAISGITMMQLLNEHIRLNEGELRVINRFYPFMINQNEINAFLILKIDPIYFNKFYPNYSNNIYVGNSGRGDVNLRRLIAEIVSDIQKSGNEYRLQLEQKMIEIGLELLENYIDKNVEGTKDKRKHIESITSYIAQHYKEQIMLGELAEHVHLNEQYLSRYFSNIMGITVSDYINTQRVYHSLEYLKYTNKNIIDIALLCGFANGKSYYKVFKKHFGKTPTEYRKELEADSKQLTGNKQRLLKHKTLEKLYCYIKETTKTEESASNVIYINTSVLTH